MEQTWVEKTDENMAAHSEFSQAIAKYVAFLEGRGCEVRQIVATIDEIKNQVINFRR